MDANFIVNDYIIIWHILFGPSISESIYKLKKKIWDTYKQEYNSMFNDKQMILKDYKNFIPNNDTVYNILLEGRGYDRLRKTVDKYRVELMKVWDKNKKETNDFYKNVIRMEIPKYKIFVVNKELNILEHPTNNTIVIGKIMEKEDPTKIVIEINQKIVNDTIKCYKEETDKFKRAILEFALDNEYATKIKKENCYKKGQTSLKTLKKWLYPYWLMYLGVPKEEFDNRMMQDNYTFDKEKYAYEKELKKMNIEEFIDFCIRNQRYIIRESKEKTEVI